MPDHIYRDRKMMKWIPFNALMEQSDYISDLLHGRTKIEKPILSPDQEAELNYNLEIATIFKTEIIAFYYQEGEILQLHGIITQIDSYQKTITVDDTELHTVQITKIEIL